MSCAICAMYVCVCVCLNLLLSFKINWWVVCMIKWYGKCDRVELNWMDLRIDNLILNRLTMEWFISIWHKCQITVNVTHWIKWKYWIGGVSRSNVFIFPSFFFSPSISYDDWFLNKFINLERMKIKRTTKEMMKYKTML